MHGMLVQLLLLLFFNLTDMALKIVVQPEIKPPKPGW